MKYFFKYGSEDAERGESFLIYIKSMHADTLKIVNFDGMCYIYEIDLTEEELLDLKLRFQNLCIKQTIKDLIDAVLQSVNLNLFDS